MTFSVGLKHVVPSSSYNIPEAKKKGCLVDFSLEALEFLFFFWWAGKN